MKGGAAAATPATSTLQWNSKEESWKRRPGEGEKRPSFPFPAQPARILIPAIHDFGVAAGAGYNRRICCGRRLTRLSAMRGRP
jgi:hypothetical protein